MLPEILNIIHEYYEEESIEERHWVDEEQWEDNLRIAFPEVTKKIFKMENPKYKREDCIHVHKLIHSSCFYFGYNYERFENLCDLQISLARDMIIDDQDFSKLKKLKTLEFCGGIIDNLLFPEELKRLYFRFSKVDFSKIKLPKYLESLGISNHKSHNIFIPSNFLDQLKNLKYLDYLRIYGTTLQSFEFSKSLEILELENCDLTNCDFLISPNLEQAYLQDNKITSLTNVKFSDKLLVLDLAKNKIKNLANVEFPDSLEELDLSYNILGPFTFGPNLKIINIEFAKYTNKLDFSKCSKLEELWICGTSISLTGTNFEIYTREKRWWSSR